MKKLTLKPKDIELAKLTCAESFNSDDNYGDVDYWYDYWYDYWDYLDDCYNLDDWDYLIDWDYLDGCYKDKCFYCKLCNEHLEHSENGSLCPECSNFMSEGEE